jgi:hypothetical protein
VIDGDLAALSLLAIDVAGADRGRASRSIRTLRDALVTEPSQERGERVTDHA